MAITSIPSTLIPAVRSTRFPPRAEDPEWHERFARAGLDPDNDASRAAAAASSPIVWGLSRGTPHPAFRIEEEAKKLDGSNFIVASRFKSHAVRDAS